MDILKVLAISKKYGIKSISQFEFFLHASSTHPKTIMELANTEDACSPEYKKALGQFIQLSAGSKYREIDGFALLQYIETGRNRRIGLTSKGVKLAKELSEETCEYSPHL